MRIELTTSSLPRKCSTPELQRLVKSRDFIQRTLSRQRQYRVRLSTSRSGRRGSNPRPTAWKAVALPTELLPQNLICKFANSTIKELHDFIAQFPNFTFANCAIETVGKDGFEPPNSEEDRFTVCCRWPLGYLPVIQIFQSQWRDSNPRPADYKSAALANWATLASYEFILINLISPLALLKHIQIKSLIQNTIASIFLGRQR